MTTEIKRDVLIEVLIEMLPESVAFLMEKGIRCLRCGEPVWGTLESAAREKGFTNEQIESFVAELGELLRRKKLRDGE